MKKSSLHNEALRDLEVFQGIYVAPCIFGFDRQQALERFKEQFKDDPDIDKVRVTRTESKKDPSPHSGSRLYVFWFRLDGSGILDKPNCPECGSDKVISKGISWYCKACGRWFIKRRRTNQTHDFQHKKSTTNTKSK